MTAADDLDTEAVGIQQIGRVIARPVARAGPRSAVAAAAGGERRLIRGVHRGAPVRGDRDVPEARPRPLPAGDDPQPRLVDAVGDRGLAVDDPPPAERVEERVVEARGALQVGDLEADVVEHFVYPAKRSMSRWVTSTSRSFTPS